jgi:hypothetical protein
VLRTSDLDSSGTKPELQQRLIDYHQNRKPDLDIATGMANKPSSPIDIADLDRHAEQRAKLASLELEIEILKKQRELDSLTAPAAGLSIDNNDMKEAIVEAVYASHIEVIEPPVFYGDPLKYTMWKIRLESFISSPRIRVSDRLNVLAKYLSGKALNVVQHLFFVPGNNYNTAMKLLDERFGDSYVINEAFRDKLANWPTIKPHDKDGLLELSDFVKQCVEVKKHVPGLERLDDGQENQRLLRHLPWWFVAKWREKIVEYKVANNSYYPPF